ncbi:hypothetical protein [Antarctobacter heliothermus]|uniref:Uncharacterized protein n=1 Tax=Antarctobacter heliothermus TaxID=74033 RepID=A0A239I366_9RHOB|nr:hypothetical protein [Antarctobacter heliothermus]SNS86784.1 hypothetical protein SAMN04488078_103814 [Antarctobacter heliothermus]
MYEPEQISPARKCRNGSIRPLPAGGAGHGIKNRRQVGRHALMNLSHHLIPRSLIKVVHCLTGRAQVVRIAGLDRVADGVLATLINAVGLTADLLQRLEKADVGGISHRMGLSGRTWPAVYRGLS